MKNSKIYTCDRDNNQVFFDLFFNLNDVEVKILNLVYKKTAVKSMSRELNLSTGTIYNKLSFLFKHFGVHSQNELRDIISLQIKLNKKEIKTIELLNEVEFLMKRQEEIINEYNINLSNQKELIAVIKEATIKNDKI